MSQIMRVTVTMSCGCSKTYDVEKRNEPDPGDDMACARHGAQVVETLIGRSR